MHGTSPRLQRVCITRYHRLSHKSVPWLRIRSFVLPRSFELKNYQFDIQYTLRRGCPVMSIQTKWRLLNYSLHKAEKFLRAGRNGVAYTELSQVPPALLVVYADYVAWADLALQAYVLTGRYALPYLFQASSKHTYVFEMHVLNTHITNIRYPFPFTNPPGQARCASLHIVLGCMQDQCALS